MNRPAPLGVPNDTQRLCSRLLGHRPDGTELLCGKPADRHIIYRWDELVPGQDPDDAWDHGFACAEHWQEFTQRWTCRAAHELTPACGMPGSVCVIEDNTCIFDGLPTTEPERTIAVAKELVA